jgi:hypothetical protein
VILAQPSRGNLPEGINFVRLPTACGGESEGGAITPFPTDGKGQESPLRDVGGRTHLTTKMEKEVLSVPQRKALAAMLQPGHYYGAGVIWNTAKRQFDAKRTAFTNSLLMAFAEKGNLPSVKQHIERLSEALRHAHDDFVKSGVEFADGKYAYAPTENGQALQKVHQMKADKEFGTVTDLEDKFAAATVRIWTTTSSPEAYKIVEELQAVSK